MVEHFLVFLRYRCGALLTRAAVMSAGVTWERCAGLKNKNHSEKIARTLKTIASISSRLSVLCAISFKLRERNAGAREARAGLIC
jgi:hypothetical protein